MSEAIAADPVNELPPPPPILRGGDETPPGDTPVETPVDTAAPDATAAPDNPFSEVSSSFGVDFSKFSNPADAELVARALTEQVAEAGLQSPNWWESAVTETPAAPELAPPAPANIDLSGLPPEVVNHIKALEGQQAAAVQRLQAEQQALHQQRLQAEQQQLQEVYRRADAQIDAFADPSLGVTGSLTFGQKQARHALVGSVNAIISGLQRSGRPVPAIEQVVKLARQLSSPTVAPTAPAPAPPSQGAAGTLGPAPRRISAVPPEQRVYFEDPGVYNEARSILSRSRQ